MERTVIGIPGLQWTAVIRAILLPLMIYCAAVAMA